MKRVIAGVAFLFGVATVAAGARVLGGGDPGYTVFRPLLLYNTAMGFAYAGAGFIAWRNAARGSHAAGAIFVLNGLVLGTIAYLRSEGSAVATESVRAMIFRTAVWLVLFLGLAWASRRTVSGSPRPRSRAPRA